MCGGDQPRRQVFIAHVLKSGHVDGQVDEPSTPDEYVSERAVRMQYPGGDGKRQSVGQQEFHRCHRIGCDRADVPVEAVMEAVAPVERGRMHGSMSEIISHRLDGRPHDIQRRLHHE